MKRIISRDHPKDIIGPSEVTNHNFILINNTEYDNWYTIVKKGQFYTVEPFDKELLNVINEDALWKLLDRLLQTKHILYQFESLKEMIEFLNKQL